MTLLDRHVARRVLAAYAFFVGVLIVVFVLLHFVEYVDNFQDGGVALGEVFRRYYPSAVPDIVRLTSPLAFFLGTLFVVSRLAQTFQVMAFAAAGVSVRRLLAPVLALAALVTAGQFGLGAYVVPKAQRVVLEYDAKYLAEDTGTQVETSNLFRQDSRAGFVAVGSYDAALKTAYRVTLLRYDGPRLVERLDAPSLAWQDAARRWQAASPVRRTYDSSGAERLVPLAALDTTLRLGPEDLARSSREVEALTLAETRAYLESLRATGSGALDAPLTSYYDRFSYPVAHLVLALLAVPLAAQRRRGGQTAVVAAGLFVACLYLAAQKLATPFGANGRLDPALAAWLPHAPFALAGLWLAARARA